MSIAEKLSSQSSYQEASHYVWGADPSDRYEALADQWRPVFDRIREKAVERDYDHRLPHEEIQWLRESGFLRVRLPEEYNGSDATLPEFFALLIELGAADTNVVNAVRSHFGFVEDVLSAPHSEWRDYWLDKLAKGDSIGAGFSEGPNKAKVGTFITHIDRTDSGAVLNGEKFYTTGSLFADWITVGVQDGEETSSVLVPREAEGVTVIDDWDGFGQALTASGTTRFVNVAVAPEWIKPGQGRFPYSVAFFQLVHLASLAGIARAQAVDVAEKVAKRDRIYTNGNAAKVSEDPQILQVIGKLYAAAYASRATVLQAARAIQSSYEAVVNRAPEEVFLQEQTRAHVEVDSTVSVVTELVLNAATILFDALGASATLRNKGLDRYWRNARTITSHNPRIYRERQVGDFAVNGTPPPTSYRVGKGS
ncbi:Dibenzothiophene desulfurization enzyme C [Halomonadaceae bacterium LMG 33818]|uniref:acyl-CoA dehydrogenase family protein n=1 Tax=Cernens ardua TaxID=3402176 RepID=UPI003EDBEF65